MREPGKLHDCAGPIHLIPKWSPRRIKLAGAAQKRGHKGQFGWNKNKKVNQLMLQNNCHFPLLSNLFSLPWNIYMQNGTKTTLGPYDIVFVQLMPVFSHVVAILE